MTVNNKKIKLCLLHSTLHIGGAEEVTANICNTINKDVFDVTVCYLKEMGTIGNKIVNQGTDVIGLTREIKKSNKTDYFTSLRLRSYLNRNNIDLVHSHDVHSLVDASLCRLTLPSIHFIHTFHFGNYPHREPEMAKFERLFWRVPDMLVAVAEKQKNDVCNFYKIPSERITTVWNGVDVTKIEKNIDIIDEYKKEGKVIIGCVNTLIEQKGMFDLIKVSKILRDKLPNRFVFVVAGDGSLRTQLEEKIKKDNLGSYVKLLGWVDSASAVILPKVDIFFQPSLWEAMSMVLLEAMAAKKAIVTTSVGETPKIICSADQGIVVEPGNIEKMASSLQLLIERVSIREKYGLSAGLRYQDNFTAAKMAARYETLYQKIINK
ncbi:MAG: glycosyltransferase family 4 protein [Candidatus Thiodiazotropha sp. (ex Clathrolucina costata)]|nr:glycosyltransferase family 4 protein [Candidatus Thiodiazotropha taylori]